MTATLGCARISTTHKNLTAQQTVGERVFFTDELSRAVGTARPSLAALLEYTRTGDSVVVAAIDRLGRSAAEVTHTIADLDKRELVLRARRREGINTASPAGRAVAAIMATLAELDSKSAESGAPHHVKTAARATCQPRSRRGSAPHARSTCVGRRPPANRSDELPTAFRIRRATAYRYLSRERAT
jgi:DNA invertase Pin-like site-specific DNA recombinase